MTAFGTIVAAIKTALVANPAVSAQVDRARLRAVPEDRETAVAIRLDSATPDRFAILNGPTDWDTTIYVECYARSAGATQTADEAVDALLGAVWARLTADTSLGGLVMDLRPVSLEYDFDGKADDLACVTLGLGVLHRTNNPSLE
jgi:hypothetical protein